MMDSGASLFQTGFCLQMPAESEEQKGRRGTTRHAALLLMATAGSVPFLSELISGTRLAIKCATLENERPQRNSISLQLQLPIIGPCVIV